MVLKKLSAGLLLLLALLSGCGGGGDITVSGAMIVPADPLVAPKTYTTFSMHGREVPWFSGFLKNSDGSESLILSSMDEANAFKITTPTPVYVLNSQSDGSVSNITNTLFDKIPNFYWARDITTFIHPETNTPAIWFCNTGREVGDPNTVPTIPRTPGVWGEQDSLFVMVNGKFVDKSNTLPQIIDYSHGCSSMKNAAGKTSLVKNILGWLGPDAPQQSILSYDNGKWVNTFVSTWNNPGIFHRGIESFYAIAGNFLKSVHGDSVAFGKTLIHNTGPSFAISSNLHAPNLESQGYTMIQGSVTGDINNDGWDDLILIMSADGVKLKPFLSGAKLALFKNDGAGNLLYDPTAFIDYYSDNEFGINIKIMDINFDGHPDIVTTGERYLYGTNLHYLKTDKVLINNGSGKFNLKTIDSTKLNSKCTEKCQIGTYFLKGKDNSHYTLISNYKSGSSRIFYSKIITQTDPLMLK